MSRGHHDPEPPDDLPADRWGRRGFLVGAGAVAGASALATAFPTGVARAALPAGASRFVPLARAVRVADTRRPARYDYDVAGPTRIRIGIAGKYGVPRVASAVVVTVTAVNGGLPNFVTVFPTRGAIPVVSNLNLMSAGEVNANLATVKLG